MKLNHILVRTGPFFMPQVVNVYNPLNFKSCGKFDQESKLALRNDIKVLAKFYINKGKTSYLDTKFYI